MHQPLGYTKVDASLEDGMVAPGVPLSVPQQEDAHSSMSGRPSSGNQNQNFLDTTGTTMAIPNSMAQYTAPANAKTLATIEVCPKEQQNGMYLDGGHTQCFLKHVDNGSIIEEPKTEMEGFIMGEHDIDVIREPVAEVNSMVNGSPADYRDLQPINSATDAIGNESYAHQKRRVQWNDNFGKELVQVHEYEASDTGDSEEEDDDADAHACACTIQ